MRSVIGLAVGCALIGVLGTPEPTSGHERLIAFADDASQALFDSTLRSARRDRVEMGGCLQYTQPVPTRVFVYHARRGDIAHSMLRVTVACAQGDGIWHTHWIVPTDSQWSPRYLRCAPSPIDVDSMRRFTLGLVVCGIGRDSIVPYFPSTP